MEFAQAYQQQDSSTMNSALKGIVAGVMTVSYTHLKKYGILYSVLPDCNRKDGLSEVIFHTEAVPRVNMMIQKLKFGKIATFDDYLKNGDETSA